MQMLRTSSMFVVAVILSFVLVGACGGNDDTPATVTPGPTQAALPQEVQLTEADDGATTQLALDGTLIVALASNPSTGFAWSVSEQSDPHLVLDGEPRFVPAGSTTPVPGAGGTEVFTFTAETAGTAQLVLEYRRSFEPNVAPAETFTVTVEIR